MSRTSKCSKRSAGRGKRSPLLPPDPGRGYWTFASPAAIRAWSALTIKQRLDILEDMIEFNRAALTPEARRSHDAFRLDGACTMKSPPEQHPDRPARRMLNDFIDGKRER